MLHAGRNMKPKSKLPPTPDEQQPSLPSDPLQDPFPTGHLLGKRLSASVAGRRLAGKCVKQTYIGRTKRGDIPDYEIVLMGESGRTVTISLVESYASFA